MGWDNEIAAFVQLGVQSVWTLYYEDGQGNILHQWIEDIRDDNDQLIETRYFRETRSGGIKCYMIKDKDGNFIDP